MQNQALPRFRPAAILLVVLGTSLTLQACVVSMAAKTVGAAADVAVTAVKVPIKIGGAVIDAAIPDGDDDEDDE